MQVYPSPAEGIGLENRQRINVLRGFESLNLRHLLKKLNIAGWSSLVARRAHNPEVVGSNPAPATKNLQLVGLAGELFCYLGTVFSVQFSAFQTKSQSVTSRPDLGG